MTSLFKSFREAFGESLVELGYIYRNLVVVDTDLSKSTKTIYFKKRFPKRFIQVGISEQDAVGVAAGLAIEGKIPVLASYAMFILRGWEQIRNTISRDNLNVKIVGTHSGVSDYMDGASHQCFEDIGLMRILPNLVVVSPSDPISTKTLLEQLMGFRGPAYMRLGRDNAVELYDNPDDIVLGKSNVLMDGEDLSIISYGAMVKNSLDAAEILRKKGFSVEVIDMHTVKPIDEDRLNRIAKKGRPLFIVEDHNVYCGLGSAISEYLSERHPSFVFKIGVEDRFGVGETSYFSLLEFLGLSPNKIVEKIGVRINGL